MAKIIDDETIENVCILAKLSLSDEAKEKAKEDMQKMLDYVEKLDELDTDGGITKKQCLQMHQKQKKDSIRYRRLSDNDREFI